MANQKKYNHPEAPENIDIKEEIQKMVSDFRAWLKKAKAKLDTKPTYVKVLVYGAIAAITILLAYKAFVFFLAWFLFLSFMGVGSLSLLIPDKFKTPEQIRNEKEYVRRADEWRKQQEEEERRNREFYDRQRQIDEEQRRNHY